MDNYELQKLRSTPCEGVAQRLGLQVSRHRCRCPFHNDHTPSMTFKGNKWKCWSGCGDGDSISLVQKMLHKDFPDACRWLANENNIILTEYQPEEEKPPKPFDASRYARYFEHPWLSDEARRFLFDERRLDPRVVRWCRISSFKDRNGVPWLSIPYYDRDGHLIGVQNRNLVKGGLPRFRFPQGCATSFYGQPVLNRLKYGGSLFIAEGVTDCMALMSSGVPAVAIPSATLLGRKDVEMLQSLGTELGTRFEMFPDNDLPGDRLFLQLSEVLPSLVRHQLPAGCKDFSEYYIQASKAVSIDLQNSTG